MGAVGPLRARTARALAGATIVAISMLLRHGSKALVAPINLYDEGNTTAGATFITHLQVPYRDFNAPYGPLQPLLGAGVRVFGESPIPQRLLAVVLGAIAVSIVVWLLWVHRGAGHALLAGLLGFLFPPPDHYVASILFFVAAVATLAGWRGAPSVPVLASDHGESRRLLVAGLFLALSVWARFDHIWALVIFSLLVLVRPGRPLRPPRWLLWPWVVAGAPYLVLTALGALPGLVRIGVWAIRDFPTVRGTPVPWSAVTESLRAVTSLTSADLGTVLLTLSYPAAAVAVALGALGLLARATGRRQWSPVVADPSRVGLLLLGSVAALGWQLAVRADSGHALPLVLPTWLLLLWQPPARRFVRVIGAFLVAVLAIPLLWPPFPELGRALELAPTAGDVDLPRTPSRLLSPVTAADFERIVAAWRSDGEPDHVFVANRRNEAVFINAPYVYTLLDAKPAAWATTFDPGLADVEAVQLGVVEALCERPAPVITWDAPSGPFGGPEHGRSRVLDRHLVANTRLGVAGAAFDYRIPVGTCLDPDALGRDDVDALRLAHLADGDPVGTALASRWRIELGVVDHEVAGDLAIVSELAGAVVEPVGTHRQRELQAAIRRWRSSWQPPRPLIGEDIPDAGELSDSELLAVSVLAHHDVLSGYLDVERGSTWLSALETRAPDWHRLACALDVTPGRGDDDRMCASGG